MKIPFLDLTAATEETRPKLDQAYRRVMDGGCFIFGPELNAFETEFAEFNAVSNCVGVANGLDGIALMLEAAGVCRGDEVIVPGHTCIATWLGVSAAGATPVPVDVDSSTFNIDPNLVSAAITARTRAVLAVHLYGQCADMTRLHEICGKHGLLLLADAAQSAGAKWDGTQCGALGDAAAFSFYPTKNLGALADGGAVVTADPDIAERVRKLRNYGGVEKNEHAIRGRNSRLGELQAAFLWERLHTLSVWNQRRRNLANFYAERLSEVPGIIVPKEPAKSECCWHLFTIQLPSALRDPVRQALEADGVGTGIYYPVPPHLTPAFASTAASHAAMPITGELANTIVSLPLHPHLSEDEAAAVCVSLINALQQLQ